MRSIVACVAMLALSCASAPLDGNRWAIRVVGHDGQFVGGVVLDVTDRETAPACTTTGYPMRAARIVEHHGFDGFEISGNMAVRIEDGRFFADLTPHMCDSNLVLSGTVEGRRAAGEASHSTLAGSMRVGRFTAERVRASAR